MQKYSLWVGISEGYIQTYKGWSGQIHTLTAAPDFKAELGLTWSINHPANNTYSVRLLLWKEKPLTCCSSIMGLMTPNIFKTNQCQILTLWYYTETFSERIYIKISQTVHPFVTFPLLHFPHPFPHCLLYPSAPYFNSINLIWKAAAAYIT